MTTAVEGGHITDLDESNRIIREIVEARNAARQPEPETHGYDSETLRAAKRHLDSLAEFQAQNAESISPPVHRIEKPRRSRRFWRRWRLRIWRPVSAIRRRPIFSRRPRPVENPKDAIGSTKLPLHLWPTAATAMGSVALLNGALKYGRNNWRQIGVRASIYVDACQRHLSAWFEGEQCDEEGVPHLGAALACLAIIIDCEAAGKLIDDRQYPGGHRELMEALTPIVKQLQERHADKSPRHYTIGDAA